MKRTKQPLTIVHLYPRDMNIYGDWGNVLTLLRRAQWHGYDVSIIEVNPGDTMPDHTDLIVGGGGQDSGQSVIQNDLLQRGPEIIRLAERNVPMLVICGLYQLFGHFFQTKGGERIKGISLFDIETYGSDTRMIGNIVTSTDFGDIIGYENHSGMTVLGENQKPFGIVKKGAGNNGRDKTEGARWRHVYGSYLHGSLLPKNPVFADALLEAACLHRYGEYEPQIIDDRFAITARRIAATRPR